MSIYIDTIELLKSISGGKRLYFSTALTIKLSPHHLPFDVWAAHMEDGELAIMLYEGEEDKEKWWPLNPAHMSDLFIIQSLYQRLKTYQKTLFTVKTHGGMLCL